MNEALATNILSILAVDHLYYRNFGWYWWGIKRELKRLGHGPSELKHLGDYYDGSVDVYYADLEIPDMIDAALVHQDQHRFHKRNNSRSFLPDGEPYILFDEDAE
jgi:hypothetical protein